MIEAKSFAAEHSLITPAATAVGDAEPTRIQDQRWLLMLSGIAIIDLKGVTGSAWRKETVLLRPDLRGVLQVAVNQYSIPTPPGADGFNFSTWFQVEARTAFAALSSVFNENESVNSGFAVDHWRSNQDETKRDAFSGEMLSRVFNGIQVDVGVRDSDAWIHRISYNMTLLGKIVFSPITIT